MYRFNHRPLCLAPFDYTLPGVFHSIELAFVFETPLSQDCEWDADDAELSYAMGAMWTSFASGKEPGPAGPEGAPKWPRYSDAAGRKQMVLGGPYSGGFRVEADYQHDKCAFWNSRY
jgi:carboxylesterase type B